MTFQPVLRLAQTRQAGELLSRANSSSPLGLSPAETNRFYAETGNPSIAPSESPGNGVSRSAASPNNTMGISPAGVDRLYNFTQLGRSATNPLTADGITPLNQTTSAPWYSSPAVAGSYTPTDNFNWNNVPTGSRAFGNQGSSPAGDRGDTPSAPQEGRRSAAPDDSAWLRQQEQLRPRQRFSRMRRIHLPATFRHSRKESHAFWAARASSLAIAW